MDNNTLHQTPGNDECGFQIMWAMHNYTGDDLTHENKVVSVLSFHVNSTKYATVLDNTYI
jgi:hypothetical protein